MARSRIISVLVSAVVLTFVALVVVRGISAFEERAFEASRALLVAGVEHAELELEGGGAQLPGTASIFAADTEVGTQVRALSQLMAKAPPGSAAAARLKASISRVSKKLNERLTAIRSEELPELQSDFDALSIMSAEGEVLVSDSSHFRIGARLLGGESNDEDAPATGARAPLPATEPLFEAAREGKSTRSTLIVGKEGERSVVWLGAAPVVFKNKLYGVVLLEEKLKSLPQPSGVSAMLLIDGEVRMGQPPDGYNPALLQDLDEPFLLRAKPAPSLVPLVGEVPVSPLFVGQRGAGIWANAFEVPGAAGATGYVLTDVTPLFSELGGFQVMTLFLMGIAWLVHVTLIMLAGRGLLAGIETISDFLGKIHQGNAAETRLNERRFPGGLHRLVRLVNKTVERGAGGVAPIAGAPSIDEVFKAQSSKSDELAFEGIGNSGTIGVEGALDSPLPEPAEEELESVEDFDPFNATGEIERKPATASATAIDDSFEELGGSDDFVGGGVAPDPLDGENVLPSDWDEGDSLDTLQESEPDDVPPTLPGSLAGSAVADLLSRNDSANEVERAQDAAILAETEAVAGGADPLEAHYREVYEQFVAARESCGESTADLSFDRFSIKLDKSREALMSKHNCSEVRFSVYVKNGKAALKATPAR